MTEIAAVVFDKDGTLFDFHATWGAWARVLLAELAEGGRASPAVLGAAMGYDLAQGRFHPDSVVIADTPEAVAKVLLPHLPGMTATALIARMNLLASAAPMAPATPLPPLLQRLRARGLRLGVATNDAEMPARAHLSAVGVHEYFDFVAGFDTGFGAKPGPGMLLAFADRMRLDPAQVVMVGDSRHDLIAGRAAGMRTVAVLTGPAEEGDLAPLADAVLPHVGYLPDWLESRGKAGSAH